MLRERNRAARGMTLIELLIVVAIMGILAAAAIPSFEQGPDSRLDLVESQVANAMDYAMYLAETTGRTHGVVFDLTADGFAVVDRDGTPVTDLLTRRGYVVTFDRPDQPKGIDFTAVNFGATGAAAVFGPEGLPEAGGTITIACKGRSRTLTLKVSTGEIVSS